MSSGSARDLRGSAHEAERLDPSQRRKSVEGPLTQECRRHEVASRVRATQLLDEPAVSVSPFLMQRVTSPLYTKLRDGEPARSHVPHRAEGNRKI